MGEPFCNFLVFEGGTEDVDASGGKYSESDALLLLLVHIIL